MEVERLDGERIFVIRGFLPPLECEALIGQAERIGFDEAPLAGGTQAVIVKEVRNNTRAMIDDRALAASLFERARPSLPPRWQDRWQTWVLAGFNERLRFYRYDPGERFAAHYDGSHRDLEGSTSFLTFMIYLNEGCQGGETRFHCRVALDSPRIAYEVRPEIGKALVFAHDELHEGAPVLGGRKYVLRTDVMYRIAP
jgi:hypothetical protein